MKKCRNGFTVIEVFVVVILVIIFVAMFGKFLFVDSKVPQETIPDEQLDLIQTACSIEEGDVIVTKHDNGVVATQRVENWGHAKDSATCEYSCGYKNRRWKKACLTLKVIEVHGYKDEGWFVELSEPRKFERGKIVYGRIPDLVNMLQRRRAILYTGEKAQEISEKLSKN